MKTSGDILPLKAFVLDDGTDVAEATHINEDILNQWHKDPAKAPKLHDLADAACNAFGIQDEKLQSAVQVACDLGEEGNAQIFHGNMHYRKVMLQTMRIISAHNHISDQGEKLTEKEMTMLLIAAATHDLGHDGQGNKGQPGYLEQEAFYKVGAALEEIGFKDDEFLEDLEAIFMATDAAPSEQYGKSYASFMKGAYKYHSEELDGPVLLPDALTRLSSNPRLSLLACMFHEADLATSAGLGYQAGQRESRFLAEETGNQDYATPKGYWGFLTFLCEGEMLTPASKHLYDDNIRKGIGAAKAAADAGNNPFPSIEELTSGVPDQGQDADPQND